MKDFSTGRLGGFTLIELLVVVLIIGILSSIALPQYTKAVMKSRYSTMMATVDALATAEEVYYLENGQYADDFEALAVRPSGCSLSADKRSCTYEWGSCRLLDPNGNDRVVCVNNTSLKNGYARYFQHGNLSSWGRVCWALTQDRNDKYAKLCENMGGSYTGHDELIGFGNGFYYKF